jgi:hypothetical protein
MNTNNKSLYYIGVFAKENLIKLKNEMLNLETFNLLRKIIEQGDILLVTVEEDNSFRIFINGNWIVLGLDYIGMALDKLNLTQENMQRYIDKAKSIDVNEIL